MNDTAAVMILLADAIRERNERDARITELGKTVESARRLTTLCNKRVKELEDALASLCETCENLRLNLLDVQTS